MSLKRNVYRFKFYTRNKSPAILTGIGVIGVAVTVATAVKATPKALRILQEAEKAKGEELTGLEVVEQVGAVYMPTAVIGAVTISCILGANAINKRRQASITSALYFTEKAFREYKKKTKDVFGAEADNQIMDALAEERYKENDIMVSNGKQLFFEEYSGRFFESTEEDVVLAEYHFNRNFVLRGYAELNELYEFLNLSPTESGAVLGWSIGAGEVFYGYQWIDFEHRKVIREDGAEYYAITMPFIPTADYMDY